MGLTDKEVTTKRLTFGEDWIEVREVRMYGDTVVAQRAAASSVATRKEGENEAAAQRIEFDISAFNLALVTSMTVAWSDNVPINEENYKKVPDEIVQVVLETVAGGVSTDEELENLEKTSTLISELPEESSN